MSLFKKYFSKVIIVISVSVFILMSSLFSVSAASSYTFDIPISKPNTTDNIAYIEVLYAGGASCEVAIFNCRVISDNSYNLDYQIQVYSDSISISPVISSSDPSLQYSITAFWVSTSGNTSFENPAINQNLSLYYPDIVGIHVYGGVKVFGLEDNNIDFTVNYGSDGVAIGQLNTIISILRQQSNSDIIANQDQNTDKIIQNQQDNQSEITGGWEQNESIDSSTTDDYASKDKELQATTEQGRSETISVFNKFGSLFTNDGHLYKGLLSVSAIFTEFFTIDWISSLINFSLALGVFAFVIGTGSELFKSAHEQHEDNKISKIDSYDERWLM